MMSSENPATDLVAWIADLDKEGEQTDTEDEAQDDELYEPDVDLPSFADDTHEPLPLEWNWQDRIPRGHVVVMAGWRESGKGLVGWNLIAHLTNGWPLPGETGPKEPASVIGVWDEDDPNEDNAWRARAAGADLSRVYDMTMLPGGTPFELSAAANDMGNIPDLLERIRQLRAAGRNPRLVILDPLDNLVMSGSVMSKQGATRLMRRLEFVARRTGVTILIPHHLVEASGTKGKVGGSSKIMDVPRWVYRIERDEDAPELMILKKAKSNQGDPDPIRYRLVRDGHQSRIEWVEREQIETEERSWRAPVEVVAPNPREQVAAWLAAGGGKPADCAQACGLEEQAAKQILDELVAAGAGFQSRKRWLKVVS